MENLEQAIPEVDLEIEGKTHKIKCSFGVLARYEKLTGRDAYDDFTSGKFKARAYIELIACALYKDPEAHIEELGEQLGAQHASKITELIKKLFFVSFPKPKEGEAEGEAQPEVTPEKATL